MVARKPEEIIEMDVAQLESLVARIEQGALEQEDLRTMRAVLESYFYVTQLIDKKSTTIARLRKLLFGEGERFTHFMGGYFFLKVVPRTGLLSANVTEVFSVPGRMAMLNGYDDRTDIGFGLDVAGIGVYAAKSLSTPAQKLNFFFRLRHRF